MTNGGLSGLFERHTRVKTFYYKQKERERKRKRERERERERETEKERERGFIRVMKAIKVIRGLLGIYTREKPFSWMSHRIT